MTPRADARSMIAGAGVVAGARIVFARKESPRSMTSPCWFCSEEIRSTDRTKVVADLSVLVHVGCFDRLYETEGSKSWSNDRRAAARDPPRDDDDEEPHAS